MTSTNNYWLQHPTLRVRSANRLETIRNRVDYSLSKKIKRNKLLGELVRFRWVKRRVVGSLILLVYALLTFTLVTVPLALISPDGMVGSLSGFAGGLLIIYLWVLGYDSIEARFFYRPSKAKHKGKWKTYYDY